MLCHVVDISGVEGRDPLKDFETINGELKAYSEKLSRLPMIVALNKCDIAGAQENIEKFKEQYGKQYHILELSALKGEGTIALVACIAEMLKQLPPAERIPADEFVFEEADNTQFEIFVDENEQYVVVGGLVDMLCRNVVLNNPESMNYFQRVLKLRGVFKELEKMGCKAGDTVVVGDVEFEYV